MSWIVSGQHGSGWIDKTTYDHFVNKMISELKALGPFDGVYLAVHGATEACRRDPSLAHGLNTESGQIVNPVVAEALGVPVATPRHATPT